VQTADKILDKTAKQMIAVGDYPLAMKRKKGSTYFACAHSQSRKFRNKYIRRNMNFECSKTWLFHVTAQVLFRQGRNVVVL